MIKLSSWYWSSDKWRDSFWVLIVYIWAVNLLIWVIAFETISFNSLSLNFLISIPAQILPKKSERYDALASHFILESTTSWIAWRISTISPPEMYFSSCEIEGNPL